MPFRVVCLKPSVTLEMAQVTVCLDVLREFHRWRKVRLYAARTHPHATHVCRSLPYECLTPTCLAV